MMDFDTRSRLERFSQSLVDSVSSGHRRVLLLGEPGVGKSTFAADLVRILGAIGRPCSCIDADPGSPSFGVPGALCRGEWHDDGWRVVDLEALCSLDAGRFRLPLISALRRLALRSPKTPLLVDAPGVVRGVAGAELLAGMVEAAGIDTVLAVVRDGQPLPLRDELNTLPARVHVVRAASAAHRLNKRAQRRLRTRLWNDHLRSAEEYSVPLARASFVGTPPPLDATDAWIGRQIALLDRHGDTVVMGEVIAMERQSLRVKMPRPVGIEPYRLLVRDARRTGEGWLSTAKLPASATVRHALPPDMAPWPGLGHVGGVRPVVQVGPATMTLVNGVFGDPLLHLRLRHQRRGLLFDLGETGRLPARIIHQVSDVLISHAHFDHIAGFLWLLRSRITEPSLCRVFGPPGLAENLDCLIRGILWDRIGDKGPRFEVAELHDERFVHFQLQAGRPGAERVDDQSVPDGVVLSGHGFKVRAATLDHGTPVLAFAFEPSKQLNVRRERLTSRGLSAGPWLTELKQRLFDDDRDAEIRLPNRSIERAGVLAEDLLLVTPGRKVVYATDLADTRGNRERLTVLARGASTFFCEAYFAEEHAEQAAATGHLTARACGEIAAAAGVNHLIPFHFSKRYETEPERIYREVRTACSRAVVPRL